MSRNTNQQDIAFAKKRYWEQKCAAKRRKIGFEMTFEEWYDVWLNSGKWEQRGRGGYVMARKGDVGPYHINNIEIKHHNDNMADTRGKKRPPRTEEHLEKIRAARKGQPSYWKGKKVPQERIDKYIATRKLNKELNNA